MLQVYRSLLYLYPAGYRREFGEEMACVFREAQRSVGRTLSARASFCFREIAGLLSGAAREHFHSFTGSHNWNSARRLHMRRFPRSTILLMIVILAGVVLTIENARDVQLKYDASSISVWNSFPGFVTFGFALVLIAAVSGWAILFALRRSGMHRLSDVQTSNDQR
jgi:hypothetical protein